MIDYGAKGCRCFRDEVDVSRDGRVERIPGRWLPSAACPHHGLLADFTERMETGTYTVISKPVTIEPRQEITAPGCSCSVNEPEACRYCTVVTEALAHAHETTEEERQRGLRAAVRRARVWFWDWRTRRL